MTRLGEMYDRAWRVFWCQIPRPVHKAIKQMYRQAEIDRRAPVKPSETASEVYLAKAGVYASGHGMTRFTKRHKFRMVDLMVGTLHALIGVGLALREGTPSESMLMQKERMLFSEKVWTVWLYRYDEEEFGRPSVSMVDVVVPELHHSATIQGWTDTVESKQAREAIELQIATLLGVPVSEVSIDINWSVDPITVESVRAR